MGVSARWLALALLLLQACAAEASEAGNPVARFDVPCPRGPCNWDVNTTPLQPWQAEGTIERVATWHENDYGIALGGGYVELSQLVPEVDSVPCFEFTLLADFEGEPDVGLHLDFDDDGSEEFYAPLPDADWRKLRFTIFAPVEYHGVRFIIRKQGTGRALLSRLFGGPGTGCRGERLVAGVPAFVPGD